MSKRNKCCVVFMLIIGIFLLNHTVFAREIIPETEAELSEINVSVQYDGSFTERLELYFNGIQKSALWYDENMENNGYTKKIFVEPGTYQFRVLSSTDLDKAYSYTYPEVINTNSDTDILIAVTQQEQTNEGLFSGHADGLHEHILTEDPTIEPMVYDFSNGSDSGIINIQAKNYGAVKSLQYILVGEEQTYEILLDRDHLFEAQVILPVGSYYESSDLEIELSDAASVRDDVTFKWSHQNNPDFFGSYYNVITETPLYINDLIIHMVSGNEIAELDSNILFADSNEQNLIQAQQQHNQEQLESAFPEIYDITSETETIAAAQEIEEEPFDLTNLLFVIGGVICGFGIGLFIYSFIRKRKH